MALDQYYTLGRSGLRVSRLSLGTMTFGEDWGWGTAEGTARAMFDRYLAAGGNFIDTADMYTEGSSESMLGKFIEQAGVRDRVVLATKFSYNAQPGNPNAGGNGRKNILRAVEGSLRRLRTRVRSVHRAQLAHRRHAGASGARNRQTHGPGGTQLGRHPARDRLGDCWRDQDRATRRQPGRAGFRIAGGPARAA